MRAELVLECPDLVHDELLFPRQPTLMDAMLLRFLRSVCNSFLFFIVLPAGQKVM